VRLRFRAVDGVNDTIVECAVDDVVIRSLRGAVNSVEEPAGSATPVSYSLLPSQPNPFNPSTQIRYDLPNGERVKLTVFDVTGRELKVRSTSRFRPARLRHLNGTDRDDGPCPGVYFYRLGAGSNTQTHRMTLLAEDARPSGRVRLIGGRPEEAPFAPSAPEHPRPHGRNSAEKSASGPEPGSLPPSRRGDTGAGR
jgi:hypothetical protein